MAFQRSPETERAYQIEAHRHLRRAHKCHPNADLLEGLVLSVTDDPTIIKSATARLYKQELIAAVDILVSRGQALASSRANAIEQIGAALAARSGIPDEPRTASRKVKEATEAEALAVFRYLAKRARGRGNIHPICMLALYVYVVPRFGCRPVEWMNASVEGDVLFVKNAKFSNGRSGFEERSFDLSGYDSRVIEAVKAFAVFAPLSAGEAAAFELWRNALAELLARACAKCGLRRLSLYSFRHVALATWKKAGLAPWEIAALAGHASVKSASAYAARRRVGRRRRSPEPSRSGLRLWKLWLPAKPRSLPRSMTKEGYPLGVLSLRLLAASRLSTICQCRKLPPRIARARRPGRHSLGSIINGLLRWPRAF